MHTQKPHTIVLPFFPPRIFEMRNRWSLILLCINNGTPSHLKHSYQIGNIPLHPRNKCTADSTSSPQKIQLASPTELRIPLFTRLSFVGSRFHKALQAVAAAFFWAILFHTSLNSFLGVDSSRVVALSSPSHMPCLSGSCHPTTLSISSTSCLITTLLITV